MKEKPLICHPKKDNAIMPFEQKGDKNNSHARTHQQNVTRHPTQPPLKDFNMDTDTKRQER